MKLYRQARRFYTLGIVTDPPVTAWEASFDEGASWVAGEAAGERFRWLVAGPDAANNPEGTTVLGVSTTPLLRDIDNPEMEVLGGTRIYLLDS